MAEGIDSKRTACRYNLIDCIVALNGALFVNAAILVLAAAVFFKRGIIVTELQQAQELLAPLLNTGAAGIIFAIALLCSGQSSTLTGTLAGQIVMEGFLNFRMRPWMRRSITRALAIIPAALTIYFWGEGSTFGLLLLSQTILSMQLPFAVVPLVQFTSDKARMGSFANAVWVKLLAWLTAGIIIVLNAWLAAQAISGWAAIAGRTRPLVLGVSLSAALALALLLLWIMIEPFMRQRVPPRASTVALPEAVEEAAKLAAPIYQRILVPLDHSDLDRLAVNHAAAMAHLYGAKLYLLHVEEGVTSQIYGPEASTAEVEAGEQYLDRIANTLRSQGVAVETSISHSLSPTKEIVRYARQVESDLIIMGAHGHGGLKDLIFGNTINPVRHNLHIPMLIVRPGKS